MSDTTCQQCPGNTVMDQEAAAQCECLDGYFRNDENRVTDSRAQVLLSPANEQPSTACTRELSRQHNNSLVNEGDVGCRIIVYETIA